MSMTAKLGRSVTYNDWVPLIKSLNTLSRVLARSRDKLKPLYLYYYNAYGHKTWQNVDLR